MANESDTAITLEKIIREAINERCDEVRRKAEEIVAIQKEINRLKKLFTSLKGYAPSIPFAGSHEIIQYLKSNGPMFKEDIALKFNCKMNQLNGLNMFIHTGVLKFMEDGRLAYVGKEQWAST